MTGDPYSWGLTPDQARTLHQAMETDAWDVALSRLPRDPDGPVAHYTVTGAGEWRQSVPGPSQPHRPADTGVAQMALHTLRQGPTCPDLPHSAEQKESSMSTTPPPATATPRDRALAWHTLLARMEGMVLATRENAKASASLARELREECGYTPKTTETEWEATAWAANRLLADLKAMTPPAVPEDPALGQGTLDDLLEGAAPTPAPSSSKCPHGQPKGWTCSRCGGPAQPELTEDGELKVHWYDARHRLFPGSRVTSELDAVTCRRCLHRLSQGH